MHGPEGTPASLQIRRSTPRSQSVIPKSPLSQALMFVSVPSHSTVLNHAGGMGLPVEVDVIALAKPF